jgi:hypothetical protein
MMKLSNMYVKMRGNVKVNATNAINFTPTLTTPRAKPNTDRGHANAGAQNLRDCKQNIIAA